MLPTYQAWATLPMALGSLFAQTWSDWECVCVDDGSTDASWDLLERARALDGRVRIERFPVNRGRGAARQRCLELATGNYLAFLDADDWLYPDKLRQQVDVLEARPELALVSSSALVTRGADEPVGFARGAASIDQRLSVASFDRPESPRLLFPPTMVRMDLARATGFDPAFKRAQDTDFLMRLLLGRRYGVLSEILYAYSQASAASFEKTIEGYRFQIKSHLKHAKHYPVRVARTVLETVAKIGVYRAFGRRHSGWLVARRWESAPAVAVDAFRHAYRTVAEHAKTLA